MLGAPRKAVLCLPKYLGRGASRLPWAAVCAGWMIRETSLQPSLLRVVGTIEDWKRLSYAGVRSARQSDYGTWSHLGKLCHGSAAVEKLCPSACLAPRVSRSGAPGPQSQNSTGLSSLAFRDKRPWDAGTARREVGICPVSHADTCEVPRYLGMAAPDWMIGRQPAGRGGVDGST